MCDTFYRAFLTQNLSNLKPFIPQVKYLQATFDTLAIEYRREQVLYRQQLMLRLLQKDYKKAFLQEKAIYKRMGDDDMSGIADIAYIATKDEDYENATLIVNYLLENASTPEGKIAGHQYLMKIKRKTSKKKDYPEIEKEYQRLFSEFGEGKKTYQLQ